VRILLNRFFLGVARGFSGFGHRLTLLLSGNVLFD
jgi:hypothetical protein